MALRSMGSIWGVNQLITGNMCDNTSPTHLIFVTLFNSHIHGEQQQIFGFGGQFSFLLGSLSQLKTVSLASCSPPTSDTLTWAGGAEFCQTIHRHRILVLWTIGGGPWPLCAMTCGHLGTWTYIMVTSLGRTGKLRCTLGWGPWPLYAMTCGHLVTWNYIMIKSSGRTWKWRERTGCNLGGVFGDARNDGRMRDQLAGGDSKLRSSGSAESTRQWRRR
eukprot:scaffold927_cov67-Skeletonema_dohrnii-CCMP3373.AAC.1